MTPSGGFDSPAGVAGGERNLVRGRSRSWFASFESRLTSVGPSPGRLRGRTLDQGADECAHGERCRGRHRGEPPPGSPTARGSRNDHAPRPAAPAASGAGRRSAQRTSSSNARQSSHDLEMPVQQLTLERRQLVVEAKRRPLAGTVAEAALNQRVFASHILSDDSDRRRLGFGRIRRPELELLHPDYALEPEARPLGLPLALAARVRNGHGCEERPRVLVLRARVDLLRRPDLDELALVHDRDLVRHRPHDGEVVGDEQVGEPEVPLEVLEEVEDLRLDGDVERGDGLVADDQLGVEREGAGDADALALAARRTRAGSGW